MNYTELYVLLIGSIMCTHGKEFQLMLLST